MLTCNNTILSATGTTLYSTSLELTHLFNYSFMTPRHYFLLPTLAPLAGQQQFYFVLL